MPISKDGIIFADTADVARKGMSWSKAAANRGKAKPAKIIKCIRRCGRQATCCARLYVPRHAMSINGSADDVSALMAGAAFCDPCFKSLKPDEFLREEVRLSIAAEFRKRNAIPNFGKAVLGRIPMYDPDYERGEKLSERASRRR